MNEYFVITTPGIEEVTKQELAALGINATTEYGGLTFKGDASDMYKANYFLRTANRVLSRIGQPFYARSFQELTERIYNLPWEKHFDLRFDFEFQVSCSHSKLMHTGVITKFAAQALDQKLNAKCKPTKLEKSIKQLINLRIDHDKLTASIDSSGQILYKRGYRQEVTRSPIRETLAAALVMVSGWDLVSPLIDPFCGSGTIPLEASQMAFNIPAGYHRGFAFTDWLDFDYKTWKSIKDGVKIDFEKKIEVFGYDRDAGAIEIAQSNAQRAGVADRVTFECQALSYLTNKNRHGWIVTNPPYGHRLQEGNDLRNLYAQLGKVLKAETPGWTLALVTNDIKLSGHSGLKFEQQNQVSNGGIKTVFEKCVIPKS
jgi:putative N6-adenine-specific DNA methylase